MALFKCSECGKEISDKAESCPNCGCPVSAMIQKENKLNKNSDNKLSKNKKARPWLIIVGAVIVLVVVASVIISSLPSIYKWSEVILKSFLPEPTSVYGSLRTNDADDLDLTVKNISFSNYENYVDECIKEGYTYVIESSASSYNALNEDGYELELDYNERNETMDVSLEVRISGKIKWSNSELAMLLPVPKSEQGSIVNDYTYGYEVYIGETNKTEFNRYISECKEKDFDLNIRKGDNTFYAENELGYELVVEYYECDLIYIDLSVPRNVADEEENEESEKETEVSENEVTESESSDFENEQQTEHDVYDSYYEAKTTTKKRTYGTSEEKYGYDKNDPFYSSNDVDKDGKLTADEWQNAMEDAIDYYGSLY